MDRPTFAENTKKPSKPWFKFGTIGLVVAAIIGGGVWWNQNKADPAATSGDQTANAGKAKDTNGKPGDASGAPGTSGASGTSGKGGPPGGGRGGFDPNRVQPVLASAARVADINVVQNALGTVAALKVATVKPRVDGLLKNVSLQEGQLVKAGDVLAEIDAEPFKIALAQVEGQLARDQAQLANARLDLERYRVLLAQDSVAKQQLDAQDSLVQQYLGTVKIDQAQVDNARLNLSYTKITAPISGRLGLRQVDPGNIVRSADATGLVVITQVDPITAVFSIPQDKLPRVLAQLKAGQKLTVDAWDREQTTKIATGFLISVDNQIDTTTGTIKLKAQFPNPTGSLFPNQFVNVKMIVDVKKGATVIPLAAIQRGSQGTIVYVIKADQTVATRPVNMGAVENDNVAIESGIAPNEMVVTDGIDRLREGAKVVVTAPFVPRQRAPGEGRRGGAGKGKPPDAAATGASPPPPAPPATTAPTPSAPNAAPIPAAAAQAPGAGADDAERAERRKRFEAMTDEQKAEFRKKRAAENQSSGK